jgi:L-amino acid N-acyltransferase YncA
MRLDNITEAEYMKYQGDVFPHFVEELQKVGWKEFDALLHTSSFLRQANVYKLSVKQDMGLLFVDVQVGWIDFQLFPSALIFQYLYIYPQYRGQGFGEAAMKAAIRSNPKKHVQSLYYNHNSASEKLHKKMGFKNIASYVQLEVKNEPK